MESEVTCSPGAQILPLPVIMELLWSDLSARYIKLSILQLLLANSPVSSPLRAFSGDAGDLMETPNRKDEATCHLCGKRWKSWLISLTLWVLQPPGFQIITGCWDPLAELTGRAPIRGISGSCPVMFTAGTVAIAEAHLSEGCLKYQHLIYLFLNV